MVNISGGDDWSRPAPRLTPDHVEQYDALWHVLKRKKILLIRVSYKWFDGKRFKKYWVMDRPGQWQKVNKPIVGTFALDRMQRFDRDSGDYDVAPYIIKREMAKRLPIYNAPDFIEAIDNKLYQAVMFADFMPRTRLWYAGNVLQNPRGELLVLKQIGGSGGAFVNITRQKVIKIKSLTIQQDFIRANKKDLRDYRVGITGDKIEYVYQRIAAPGSLYTNVHLGARMEFAALKDVGFVTSRAKEILSRLSMFRKKILSLDFMVDEKTHEPLLVESNSYPGTANFGQARLDRYLSNLVDHLLS